MSAGMKPVSLVRFGLWFALLGVLLGVPGGVLLTWYIGREWQAWIVLAAAVAALVVVRIATSLKVHVAKSPRANP